jgi:NAD dependent epimerase/dehydratase family enzyme
MSWVHISDVVGAIEHVLDNAGIGGPVNVVAPSPATNAEFTRTLAAVLHRPAIFPLPAFAVRLALGEMGEALLLGSQRVEPGKLRANGYEFQFSQLAPALASILQG